MESYRYDGHGRLHAALEWDGNKKTETLYTWCGNAICATRDAQGRPLARYFRGGHWRSGQGRAYYARDHLGSVRDVLDEQGRLLARHDYDPYGNLIGPGPGPDFGYAGMLRHAPSGLYLTRYRAYDPRSGRWLSRDPIGEAGGVNLYAYVGGNPVSFVDPLGLAKTCKRPLGNSPIMVTGEPLDSDNVEIAHEHIFLENGKKFYNGDKDIGYFGADADSSGGVRADKDENLDKYSVCDPANKYNDDIMIQAVEAVRGGWRAEDYDTVSHNCQGFVAHVLRMYDQIVNPPITVPPDFGFGQMPF